MYKFLYPKLGVDILSFTDYGRGPRKIKDATEEWVTEETANMSPWQKQ